MNEMYFVPSLSFNLLLVDSITDMGFTLVFDNKRCTIYQDKKIVGREVRDGKTGLYRYLVSQPAFKICAVTSIPVAQLWQCRLGHLNMHCICALENHKITRGVPFISAAHYLCDSCVLHKQSHKPAPKQGARPCASNLCGEIRPALLERNQ